MMMIKILYLKSGKKTKKVNYSVIILGIKNNGVNQMHNKNFATRLILQAMKVTREDIIDEFRNDISDVNYNGLDQAVWARRAKVLERLFRNQQDYKMLHIKRGFWELNPIFNVETGELYLLMSKDNLRRVKNKYHSLGSTSHYSYDFLLYNRNLIPEVTNIDLFPSQNDEERRMLENKKMLGSNYENVSCVYLIVVDYYANEAIDAKRLLLNDSYELVEEVDLNSMLHENADSEMHVAPKEMLGEGKKQNAPMVKLKKKFISEEN